MAKIGDIIEIRTSKGFAYAQYTHQNRMMGALIRVFDRIHAERPNNLSELVYAPVRFMTFFPLKAALRLNIFEVLGNYEVALANQRFPIFRAGGRRDPVTNEIEAWWLWDGEKEWKIGSLSEEQRKFPRRSSWNDTLLIERIDQGWTSEND